MKMISFRLISRLRAALTLAAVVLCATAIVLPREAAAVGVLVVGKVGGFSFAIATHESDVNAATQQAIALCRANKDAVNNPPLRADCKVIATFSDKCAVVAWDPAPNYPGVGIGWSIAPDLQTAQRDAIAKCEATVKPGRSGTCVVSRSKCDGKAQ
jgi:hypothetical protein